MTYIFVCFRGVSCQDIARALYGVCISQEKTSGIKNVSSADQQELFEATDSKSQLVETDGAHGSSSSSSNYCAAAAAAANDDGFMNETEQQQQQQLPSSSSSTGILSCLLYTSDAADE